MGVANSKRKYSGGPNYSTKRGKEGDDKDVDGDQERTEARTSDTHALDDYVVDHFVAYHGGRTVQVGVPSVDVRRDCQLRDHALIWAVKDEDNADGFGPAVNEASAWNNGVVPRKRKGLSVKEKRKTTIYTSQKKL